MGDVLDFSRAMQYVKSQYSFYFHKKYRVSGSIWRERFKGLLIENENYMKACGQYVENNPVQAGLVENPKEWQNSSYRYYHSNAVDELIDYDQEYRSLKISRIDDEEDFEKGKIIGSAFFRFQLCQKLKIR